MESANKSYRQRVAEYMGSLSMEERRRYGQYLNPTGTTPFITDYPQYGPEESVQDMLRTHGAGAVKLA